MSKKESFACSNSILASNSVSGKYVAKKEETTSFQSHELKKTDAPYKKCRRCNTGGFSRVWGWFHKKKCNLQTGKLTPISVPSKNGSDKIAGLDCNKQKKRSKNLECDQCDFRAYFKSGLEKHILFKHTPDDLVKWHPCHLCQHRSKRKTDLKVHLNRMHYQMEKKFECGQCTYASHFKENLRKHILSVHIRTHAYKCKLCDYKSSRNSILKEHVEKVHSVIMSRKFSCDQCSYTSDKKPHMAAHKVFKHTPKELIEWIKCGQCHYKTHYSLYLVEHIKRKHSLPVYKPDKKKLLCDECPYVTNSLNCFKKHKISRHLPETEIQWYNCNICDYKSKTSGGLHAHFKFQHLNYSRKFFCDECAFHSLTKKKLVAHKLDHLVGESLACDKCTYTSQIKYEFDQHCKTEHIVKEFKCKSCPYIAASMNSVKGHVRRMHSQKQKCYKCHACEFSTKRFVEFKKHEHFQKS